MRISGLQRLTLLDFPKHTACTVFLGHCNLRCPFCHNMDLVLHPEKFDEIKIDELLKFLERRVNKLDGVAITGGEPLLNDDIDILIKQIKNMGFLVKLDTNGFFPIKLKELYEAKLLDMVAMDIKAGFLNYKKAIGIDNIDFEELKNNINTSIDLIMNSGIEYEFRTTCVKGIHTDKDFYEIKDMIKGANAYYLQNYNSHEGMENLPFKPFSKEELTKFMDIIKENIKKVSIRGLL